MPKPVTKKEESYRGAGPKGITIEEYHKRNHQKKKPVEPKVPVVKLPKKRGGVLVNLRRSLAALRRYINTAPQYHQTHKLWQQVEDIQVLIKDEVKRRKTNRSKCKK